MRKDRLVLVLLLTMFALLGAECRSIGLKDDEDKRLPSRALAASPLLRTYYDTLTTPSDMDDIKIPEDHDDLTENGPLEVKYDMGGSAVITDVRTRMRICGPVGKDITACDLQCRMISPNGTASGWKNVDFATEDNIDTQVEVYFRNEFDGLISDGTWRVELRDGVDDNDGRCVFRNGTLRLNFGEAAPGGAANETQLLALTADGYTSLPEIGGARDNADWGQYGANAWLRVSFVFTTSFTVRGFVVSFSIHSFAGFEIDTHLWLGLIAPSGGWFMFQVLEADGDQVELYDESLVTTWTVGLDTTTYPPESFHLRGEPSAGTWTLVLWDTGIDSNKAYLSHDGSVASTLSPNMPASLQLTGVS